MTCCIFSPEVTADIIQRAVTRPKCGREKIVYRADTAYSITKIFSSRDTSLLNKHLFVYKAYCVSPFLSSSYDKYFMYLHDCEQRIKQTKNFE